MVEAATITQRTSRILSHVELQTTPEGFALSHALYTLGTMLAVGEDGQTSSSLGKYFKTLSAGDRPISAYYASPWQEDDMSGPVMGRAHKPATVQSIVQDWSNMLTMPRERINIRVKKSESRTSVLLAPAYTFRTQFPRTDLEINLKEGKGSPLIKAYPTAAHPLVIAIRPIISLDAQSRLYYKLPSVRIIPLVYGSLRRESSYAARKQQTLPLLQTALKLAQPQIIPKVIQTYPREWMPYSHIPLQECDKPLAYFAFDMLLQSLTTIIATAIEKGMAMDNVESFSLHP